MKKPESVLVLSVVAPLSCSESDGALSLFARRQVCSRSNGAPNRINWTDRTAPQADDYRYSGTGTNKAMYATGQ